MASVLLLIGVSGFPEWAVLLAAGIGAAGMLFFAYDLGWFKAPFPIGRPLRVIIVLCLICGIFIPLCWAAWPRVKLYPQKAEYKTRKVGETFDFRIVNDTPYDQYMVTVLLTVHPAWLAYEDVAIEIPKEYRKPLFDGSAMTDTQIHECRSNEEHFKFIAYTKLLPKEVRGFRLKQRVGATTGPSPVIVDGEVAFYTDVPTSTIQNTSRDKQDVTTYFRPTKNCAGSRVGVVWVREWLDKLERLNTLKPEYKERPKAKAGF